MQKTFETLNQMVRDGVISRYAIGGAVAAYNYIEPTLTEDIDILVSFDEAASPSGLVLLTPIVKYLARLGYAEFRHEGIVIAGWPVQFLPVASALDLEALVGAIDVNVDLESGEVLQTRMLSAEHVMATAIALSRPKDQVRLMQFVEAGAFDSLKLCGILDRHGLLERWTAFCTRFELPNPCGSARRP